MTLLPPPTAQNYSFRNRPQNKQLPNRISRITAVILLSECCAQYALIFIHFNPALCFILMYNCSLKVRNKRICYVMSLCSDQLNVDDSEQRQFPLTLVMQMRSIILWIVQCGQCETFVSVN